MQAKELADKVFMPRPASAGWQHCGDEAKPRTAPVHGSEHPASLQMWTFSTGPKEATMKALRLILATVVLWAGVCLAFAQPDTDYSSWQQVEISKKDGDIIGD